MKSQFLQELIDNINQRFPVSDVLQKASVLNKSLWPDDALDRAVYGEMDIADLCKHVNVRGTVAADILLEFAIFKKTGGRQPGSNLKYFIQMIETLPVATADCE